MKKIIILLFITSFCFAQKSDFSHIDFSKADTIAKQFKNASIKNLPRLANNLTHQLNTDVEKFRAIYYWVATNIKSDYNLTNKVLRKGKKLRTNRSEFIKWNKEQQHFFINKLITKKETICTGYSILLRELCKLANIECKVINGYYKDSSFDSKKPYPNHSWNAVLLDNKWYLCDPTLASGYFFVDIDTFVFDYNDGYFLTEPILFARNHYPEEEQWTLLEKNKISFNDFIDSPFVYGKTFEHSISPILPKELEHKTSTDKEINFKLQIEKEKIDKLEIVTNNGWKDIAVNPKTYTYKNGILEFKHQFIKKGLYDVHLKIADDIVTTYTIEVL